MELTDLLVQVADTCAANRIRFILIGGMAVSTWMEPRLTKDMDIVVSVRRRDAPRLKKALVEAGTRVTALEMRLLYERRFIRCKTAGHYLDVKIRSSAHDHAADANARTTYWQGRAILVATPEDLILYKLQAWRLIDQDDVAKLIKGVRTLNVTYIESWLDPIARDTGSPMRLRWSQARSIAE